MPPMSYPFFIASLPSLRPDGPPPFTVEQFVGLARGHLAPSDQQVLEAMAGDAPSGHAFVREYRRHETQLRNAVARHRATRLGLDPAPWLRTHEGYDVSLERGVANAFQEANPLRREQALDALRWRRIGELAGFDPFSATAVFAYFLRLRILLGAAARDAEQGRQRRQAVVTTPAAPAAAT